MCHLVLQTEAPCNHVQKSQQHIPGTRCLAHVQFLLKLAVVSAMQDLSASGSDDNHRFRLVNALNGEHYAIPEVGTHENWTVSLRDFPEVQDLKGKYLWRLEPVPGSRVLQRFSSRVLQQWPEVYAKGFNQIKLQPSRLESGAYAFSEAPVRAVLDSFGDACCYGPLRPDTSGCISCVFGLTNKLRVSSLSCGLTNTHVTWSNPYMNRFAYALGIDLREIFMQQECHGLFLCEMGSQKAQESIDMCFQQRKTEFHRPRLALLDDSPMGDHIGSLKEYLVSLLKLHRLTHLEVLSLPPYAYIGNPNILSVKSPEAFHPLPEDQERRAVHYDMVFKPTGDKISVVCIHSPSSAEWSPLSTARKKLFSRLVWREQEVDSQIPPRNGSFVET